MTQHPPSANWDHRWHPHYQSQNAQYSGMEASPMIPSDPRVSYSAPIQPQHEPQYAIGTTYAMPSVPSMAPHTFGVNPYTPASPTSMVMPFRQYGDERPPLNESSYQHRDAQQQQQQVYRRNYVTSPPIKRDPAPPVQLPLPQASAPAPAPAAKRQSSAEPETKPFQGDTLVDQMMRAIQAQESDGDEEELEEEEDMEDDEEDEEEEDCKTALHSPPHSNMGSRYSSPRAGKTAKSRRNSKAGKEKRKCPWEGCKQTFTQGTHMKIHMRKHTGEKPYSCTYENCPWTFSQHGNLRTHYRRHTGEKPYKCDQCPREFAQKGNLRAHLSVHDPTKRFHCLIDNCNKPFTQRGNLKNHQNKFHKEAVIKYMTLFSENTIESLEDPEHRKLFVHFKEIYKNMNRGIKGRGVGRTIQNKKDSSSQKQNGPALHDMPMYPVQQRTPPIEHSMPHQFSHPVAPSYPGPPQHQHQGQHAHPHHHGLQTRAPPPTWQGYPVPTTVAPRHPSDAHYVMPAARPPYEMYDMEQENMSSGGSSAGGTAIHTPASSVYEEEHNRGLAFRERMY
ncbi:hypothetical protein BJ166DRAFT_598618 [Pestalotiopsis sp. NC0098]|nr:hypothetical protein BJ166DRAFT_598618 [Pestalotiopsis sp. NC0098]